jgi:hypothetical protein
LNLRSTRIFLLLGVDNWSAYTGMHIVKSTLSLAAFPVIHCSPHFLSCCICMCYMQIRNFFCTSISSSFLNTRKIFHCTFYVCFVSIFLVAFDLANYRSIISVTNIGIRELNNGEVWHMGCLPLHWPLKKNWVEPDSLFSLVIILGYLYLDLPISGCGKSLIPVTCMQIIQMHYSMRAQKVEHWSDVPSK